MENGLLAAHLVDIAHREKIKIDSASVDLIVGAAEGSVRDALSILDKLSAYGDVSVQVTEQLLGTTNTETVQAFLGLLASRDAVASLEFLEQLFGSGVDPVQFNKDFLEYCRKLLVAMNGGQVGFSFSESQQVVLGQQASAISVNQLLHIIRLFLRANKDFQTSRALICQWRFQQQRRACSQLLQQLELLLHRFKLLPQLKKKLKPRLSKRSQGKLLPLQ